MECVFRKLWRRLASSHSHLRGVRSEHTMHRPFERESTLQQHCCLPRYAHTRFLFHAASLCSGWRFTSDFMMYAVNGSWDEWAPWSLCSSTCGRGYRDRVRTCKQPRHGGAPCRGPTKQTKFCNIAVCPGQYQNRLNIKAVQAVNTRWQL